MSIRADGLVIALGANAVPSPAARRLRLPAWTAHRRTPVLVLLVVVGLTYLQFLPAGFATSDWWPVLANNRVESWDDLVRLFQEPIGAYNEEFIRGVGRHYRPLAAASYALDLRLWGIGFPTGFQLTNLAVHLGATAGVYALARTLGLRPWLAGLAGAVFALHPAAVATVPGIARRHDTLSLLFALPSLVLLLRARHLAALVLASVLFLASLLAKESTLAILPLVPVLLLLTGRSVWRGLWLLAPAALALAMRISTLGSLGGYGTATLPTLDALPAYKDAFVTFWVYLLWPGPELDQDWQLALALAVFSGAVLYAARQCRPAERRLVLLGYAWLWSYALFYTVLKVANSWYLYQANVGLGLILGGLVQAAWLHRQTNPGSCRSTWRFAPAAVSGVALLLLAVASPIVTRYGEWNQIGALVNAYLATIDTCTDNGHLPLSTGQRSRANSMTTVTGLLRYSTRAYVRIKYAPTNQRPCSPDPPAFVP